MTKFLSQESLPFNRQCGFWNLTTQEWSTRGCKLNVSLSNRGGVKGFLKNVQKTALFLFDGFPYVNNFFR